MMVSGKTGQIDHPLPTVKKVPSYFFVIQKKAIPIPAP